jgi:spoIIIJ-associated protein
MSSIEITGKNIDEAKKAAAAKLGASADEIQVEVLEETKGLFGKAGSVKIRATLASAPAPAEKKKEKPEPKAKPAPKAGRAKKAEKAAEPEPEAAAAPVVEAEESEEKGDVVATQEDADRLALLVRGLLDTTGLDVAVRQGGFQSKYVTIELDGKDAAFLIGKHGEVINAMQYLINIIAGRKFDNGVRVTLDGGDYRKRREEALTGLATKIAKEVERLGQEAVLDALPAFERRIVHKALSEYAGVTTYSEGEEPNRRVVIAPAD